MELLLRCTRQHKASTPLGFDVCDFVAKEAPATCPQCGNTTGLYPLVRVFLIVEDKNGPIYGYEGRRYRCAGDQQKTEIIPHQEAFTTEPRAVTNPACKQTAEYKQLMAKVRMEQLYTQGGINLNELLAQE